MTAIKIRCKVCGENFYPNDETMELMSDGYIISIDVKIYAECWNMIYKIYADLSDMINDADSGL
jgi:hypothetical protein